MIESFNQRAKIAQLEEHILGKNAVASSSLAFGPTEYSIMVVRQSHTLFCLGSNPSIPTSTHSIIWLMHPSDTRTTLGSNPSECTSRGSVNG